MREDDRHGGFHDDVPGSAAEDHLPEAALRIGALHHEVGADRLGLVEVELARGAPVAWRDSVAARSSAEGPGVVPPSTLTTWTLLARLRKGMAKATVRAVSVLPFQATSTCSPIVASGTGGVISTGRPLSNRASSRVASASEASFAGRSTTIRSKTRPSVPVTEFWRPASSRHSALGPSPPALPTGTPCWRMKEENSARACSRRSCPSRSRVRSTSEEIEKPISPPNTTAYSLVRAFKPVIRAPKRRATSNAVSSSGAAVPSPTMANMVFITNLACHDGSVAATPVAANISRAAALPHPRFERHETGPPK